MDIITAVILTLIILTLIYIIYTMPKEYDDIKHAYLHGHAHGTYNRLKKPLLENMNNSSVKLELDGYEVGSVGKVYMSAVQDGEDGTPLYTKPAPVLLSI